MRHAWILILLLVSCDDKRPQRAYSYTPPPPGPHEETSPELEENGKVLEIAFRMGSSVTTSSETPRYTKTIAKSVWDDPWGLHNRTINVPSTQSSSTVTVQDQFAVVFECQQHQKKFIIESLGKESIAGKLWQKLKQGDPVKIRYREIYRVYPDDQQKDLIKYDFIDANPQR